MPFSHAPAGSGRISSGDELDRFLDGRALPRRKRWYLTNFYDFYSGKKYDYTADDFAEALPRLQSELEYVQPELIVAMGREVARLFLGDVDIHDVEGIPWYLPASDKWSFLRKSCVVFPLVHIAAAMRNPELSPYVVAGFQQLAEYLAGRVEPRELFKDPIPEPRYEEITTEVDLQSRLQGLSARTALAVDTEGWPHNPWSLQFSVKPGEGYCILATDRVGLAHFSGWLHREKPLLVFHSSLHDLAMLRALGINTEGLEFSDTQVMAYLLQIAPLGLKAGCLRECNMPMDDYSELVADADTQLAIEYLMWLWDLEEADHAQACLAEFERRKTEVWTDAKGKIRHGRRITKIPSLPKTPLHKAVGRCLQSKRPRQLWGDQVEDIRVAGHDRLGPLPEATLDFVPRGVAIRYGCRDADGTLRLHDRYGARIDSLGLREVYNLELATYPLLDRMQRIGLKPDLDHFAKLSRTLQTEIDTVRDRLARATGRPTFNANSGDQVADYLFDDLGLDEIKWTSSGRGSTNDKVLEALEREHPELPILWRDDDGHGYNVIGGCRYYREIYKLKHTFCVAPETKILTRQLVWCDANSLKPGQVLIGFDEDAKRGRGRDHHRHWRPSTILSMQRITKPCYRLTFDDGTSVVCSTDHRWLARSTSSYGKAVWVRADQLCVEDRPRQTRHEWEIIKPLEPWKPDTSFNGGYLSGLFDGEGCLQRPRYSLRLDFTQKAGVILGVVKASLEADHFTFSDSCGSRDIHHLTTARTKEVLRFLGTYRPIRLLRKFRELLDADRLPRMNMAHTVRLVSREYLGEQEVIALETSTHTFIAEGLASHNCDRLPEFVHRWPFDGRVHTTLRTTRVVTGRLAASDPNVLAQPEHGKWAKDFKRGWVCDAGHILWAGDESQIELRGLAHLSQDAVLLAVYRGELRNPDGSLIDLHAKLAQRIFGGKIEQYMVKCAGRLAAKAINFGIPMGMTNRGLSVELRKNGVDADEETAQRWLDETLALYKGVSRYMGHQIKQARRDSFIRCLSGRIRYIGGIRSRDERVREEAERFAFSTPIQESATFIMKQAEVNVYSLLQDYWKRGQYVEPLIQIHDCLKLECEEELVQDLNARMLVAMTQVPKGFSVPLAVESEAGYNMADMRSL